MPVTNRSFLIASILFFLSGLTALVYEILWLKELRLLFGASSYAIATTLTAFFLGLGFGGEYWGKKTSVHANPLLLYGILELGIAFSALGYFLILDLYSVIYSPLFREFGSNRSLFTLIKFIMALCILFPPAFFMGGTLPTISQFAVKRNLNLGPNVSLLYAINTLGAVLGACLAGFFLPRFLGFNQSYWLAISISVLIALLAIFFSTGTKTSFQKTTNVNLKPLPHRFQIIAFISGFLTLALQVLWNRMFAQVLQNSVYTFALILMVFLFCLALGSFFANRLMHYRQNQELILFFMLFSGAALVLISPFTFVYWTDNLHYLGANKGWPGYLLEIASVALVILGIPLIFLGTVFPLLIKLGENLETTRGILIGRLAAINTLGAITGSLLTGFVILDSIGLWGSIRLMAVLYFLTAWLSLNQIPRHQQSRWVYLPAFGLLLSVSILDTSKIPVVNIDPVVENESLLEYWESSAGTVAVIRKDDQLKIKLDNHYTLGGTGSYLLEQREAVLPISVHINPKSVYHIGLGTGISAGGALTLPISRLIVTEINAAVITASEKYFGEFLNGLFFDPRVQIIEEDGKNYLRGTNEQFDVIISDLFIPWKAGVGSLYSREHYQTIFDRLNDHGLFMQWLPAYQITEQEFNVIANTLLNVFPQVTVWRGDYSPLKPIIGLLAHKEPVQLSPLTRIAGNFQEKPPLLSYFVGELDPLRPSFKQYPVNTDDKPYIEFSAPISQRQVKESHNQWLTGENLLKYLRRIAAQENHFLEKLDLQKKQIPEAGLHLQAAQIFRYQGKLKLWKQEMTLYDGIATN
jgi:spermidine synthase